MPYRCARFNDSNRRPVSLFDVDNDAALVTCGVLFGTWEFDWVDCSAPGVFISLSGSCCWLGPFGPFFEVAVRK